MNFDFEVLTVKCFNRIETTIEHIGTLKIQTSSHEVLVPYPTLHYSSTIPASGLAVMLVSALAQCLSFCIKVFM